VNVIRDCRPDIVFTPDPFLPYEAHLDHYYTGRAASMAVMRAAYRTTAGRSRELQLLGP